MSPELLYKPKLVVQALFLPSRTRIHADERTMQKIDQIFCRGIEYIQQFVEDFDPYIKHTTLEYYRDQLDKEAPRLPDAVKVAVFVEDIEETNSLKAFAIGYRSELHIPQKTIDKLPDDLQHIGKLQEEERTAYDLLLNHFLHEVLHMFGAFHSDSGIMSGVIKLHDDISHSFQLVDVLDYISAKIVSETLLDEVFKKSPCITMSFDVDSGSMNISSDTGIRMVVFMKQTYYTDSVHLVNTSNFHCTVPEKSEWDSVFVQFEYGASVCYTQYAVFHNGGSENYRSR